jgi:hypothetical protein
MTVTTANIDIGSLPNDGTGDPLRTAFEKINDNFLILEELAPQGPNGSFQFNNDGIPNGTGNFTYVSSDNVIQLGIDVRLLGNVSIGNTTNRLSNLYVGNSALYLGNVNIRESANVVSFPISVLPSSKASLAADNINADGNVVAVGKIQTANLAISELQVTTSNNSTNQVLFQIPATEFVNGIVYVHTREVNSNNSQSVTLAVNKNNNNNTVGYSVYGTIFVGTVLTDYDVDIGYGNVRVMVNPLLNANMVHTVSYQYTI